MDSGTAETVTDGLEVLVHGRPVDPFAKPPACNHRQFGLDGFSAAIQDEGGKIEAREIRVRVRCMGCGLPMTIDLAKVRRPKGGELHGIVLVLEPMEDG
jgi:hypothetical protein